MDYDNDTIILRDKIYIPTDNIDAEAAMQAYTHHMFQDKDCMRCPNRSERPNYECEQCASYKGSVSTGNTVYKNGIEYFGAPMGDRLKIQKRLGIDFDEFDTVDLRKKPKFDYPVRMRKDFKLREHQQEAEDAYFEYKHGLIVAPPRSGKTPTMLHICIELGLRTILLAKQHDFLQQFVDHIEEFTNLPKMQERLGIPLYGFPKKQEDFDTLQIAVCTYQQFIAGETGRKRFNRAIKNFGTVMVDEVHTANANEFARVLNRWPSKFRLGVTGTDKRKDGRHVLMQEIIGPVVKRIEIDQLEAKLIVHPLMYVKSRAKYTGPAGFTYCCKFLAEHEKRMEEILNWVVSDLRKGHSIVIPVLFKDHVWDLVKRINDLAGTTVAEGFVGGGTKKNKELRESILDRARSGKTRVVVGIRSIIQLGLNVPRWSALYYIMPMSNEPNWKQESSRVLTPLENKRDPIIRMFVEPEIGMALGCFIATYKSSLKFKHKPSKVARERAAEMFELHGSGRGGMEDAEYGFEVDHEKPQKAHRSRLGTAGNKTKAKTKEKSKPAAKSRQNMANSKTPKGLFNR